MTEQSPERLRTAILRELPEHPVNSEIAAEVVKWRQTQNPHHIDVALLLCRRCGAPISPALQAEVTDAAAYRLSGSPPGTSERTLKRRVLDDALLAMARLRHAGLEFREAAEIAAERTVEDPTKWMRDRRRRGIKTSADKNTAIKSTQPIYKPSTLLRYFRKDMKRRYEQTLKPAWERDHTRREWLFIVAQLYPCGRIWRELSELEDPEEK